MDEQNKQVFNWGGAKIEFDASVPVESTFTPPTMDFTFKYKRFPIGIYPPVRWIPGTNVKQIRRK